MESGSLLDGSQAMPAELVCAADDPLPEEPVPEKPASEKRASKESVSERQAALKMQLEKALDEPDAAAEGPPAAEDGESFGPWLRRQREMRDITLREIADTSKISLRYLQAFEDERFDLLPALVFAKGFLREYALYVGMDPEEAVNFFLVASAEGDDEPTVVTPPPQTSPVRLYALAGLVALILLAAVWGLEKLNQRDAARAPAGPETAEPATGTPAGTPAAGTPAAAEPAAGTPAAVETTAFEPAGTQAPPAAPLVVILDFRGDCWIEASVDGERHLATTRVQGESARFEAQEAVGLILGNSTVVDIEVNGLPYALDRSRVRQELVIDLGAGRPAGGADAAAEPVTQELETPAAATQDPVTQ